MKLEIYKTDFERSKKNLESFFGGEAEIYFVPATLNYQISIRNDDLKHEFLYQLGVEHITNRQVKQAELTRMLDKYIKQMEIEQELMRKGKL